jgi:plastocyanin
MISTTRVTICGALLALSVGCGTIASTTRTGTIHEVRFAERMTPTTLLVRPGDEIRWVNQRSTAVTVEFLEGAFDNLSCASGFSRRTLQNLRGRLQESATIRPNDSASLCFAGTGTISYNARMDSPVAGGQTIESGTIRVGQ